MNETEKIKDQIATLKREIVRYKAKSMEREREAREFLDSANKLQGEVYQLEDRLNESLQPSLL